MRMKFFIGLSIGLLLFGFVGMANAITVEFNYHPWSSASVVSTGFFSGEDDNADGFLTLAELTDFKEATTLLAAVTLFSFYEIGSLKWTTVDFFANSTSYPVYYATTPSGRQLNSDWKKVWITSDDSIGVGPDPDGGPAPVPEPSTVLLLGSGLVGLVWYGRKRKKT